MELALNGAGHVSPNPLVGAVLVHDGRIIGEGWHRQYGGPHAEVNAITSVKQEHLHLIAESTLYVNLEPCSHHGKTPPCSTFIVDKKIPRVVVANIDPNPLVAGTGIDRLVKAGCEVTTGVMEHEGEELNRRFFTNQRLKRPYIILKWAQSADGYFTRDHSSQSWITGDTARKLVHRWRCEEDAILVGSGTALVDNPQLDIRFWPEGKQPLRAVVDRHNILPASSRLLDGSIPTVVFTINTVDNRHNVQYIQLNNQHELPHQILKGLSDMHIGSVIVEGGARVLENFISLGLWDEARVFVGSPFFGSGIVAPSLGTSPVSEQMIGDDRLYYFKHLS